MKKKLIVIYNGTEDNESIVQSDFEEFFKPLNENPAFNNAGVVVDFEILKDKEQLLLKIDIWLSENYEELYLHFSNHGNTKGFPYDEWIFTNEDLITKLKKDKIKFCFFSACQSGGLSKLANLSGIPVVIGASGENNLGNSYMIKFQRKFYYALSQKNSFDQAFREAQIAMNTAVEQDEDDIIERGGGSASKLKAILQEELKLFASEDDRKQHLIYKNFGDRIGTTSKGIKKLLFYTTNEETRDLFIAEYNRRPFKEQQILIHIGEVDFKSDFKSLERSFDRYFGNHSIKVLMIIETAGQKMSDGFKKIFDRKEVYENDNVDFCFAESVGSGLVKNFLEGAQYLNKFKEDRFISIPARTKLEERIDWLFADITFTQFLDGLSISVDNRIMYTMNFPFTTVRNDFESISDPTDFIRVFFGKRSNENLVHFMINFMKYDQENGFPNLLIDDKIGSGGGLHDDFWTKFNLEFPFPDTIDAKDELFHKLSRMQLTFVIKTGIKDQQLFNDEVQKILEDFAEIGEGFRKTPLHFHLFFVMEDEITWDSNLDPNLVKTKIFGKPKEITPELIAEWPEIFKPPPRNRIKELEQNYQELKSFVEKLPKEYDNEKCPSGIIKVICEKFVMPDDNFLKVK